MTARTTDVNALTSSMADIMIQEEEEIRKEIDACKRDYEKLDNQISYTKNTIEIVADLSAQKQEGPTAQRVAKKAKFGPNPDYSDPDEKRFWPAIKKKYLAAGARPSKMKEVMTKLVPFGQMACL